MSNPDDDALQKLRAAGVANREAQARAASSERSKEQAARLYAGERATSAIGVFASSTWWALVLSAAIPGVLMAVAGVVYPEKAISGRMMKTEYLQVGLITVGIASLLAVVIVLAKRIVRSAASRERAWAATLPFVLDGYFDYYGSGYGRFVLAFAGQPPDHATLEPLVAGLPGFVLDERSTALEIDRIVSSGQARWREWHSVVDRFLVPLHGRYPLVSVTFS